MTTMPRGTHNGPAGAGQPHQMRICFIGDSFVAGAGDSACLGWVGRVAAAARGRGLDLTAYNLGVRRDTTRDIAERWIAESRTRLPDGIDGRLVFSFGVNDRTDAATPFGTRIAMAESLANAEAILRVASARRPVLMIGPPPIAAGEADTNLRIRALSDALAPVCHHLDVPWLPVFDALAADPVWMAEVAAGDGAHPDAAGYGRFAGLVEAWPVWRHWTGQA
ncbi:GDSL-type esterase/lipase family protein [Tistrella bauzanensis]|uniref:GDSL-type esterase/lipase family protein n=1 Tax=Tistrella arctica TaxID=3133430 RepID=A0ABU9YK44_9PROT